MSRRIICFLVSVCFCYAALAHHVKGGYIQYQYEGSGSSSGTSVYKVTVTVFYGCGIAGPRASVTLNTLDAASGSSISSVTIPTTTSETVTKGTYNPCMSNPPTICYEVYTYVTSITVSNNTAGYILSVTDQYRTDNIINIANSSSTGIAITAQIPGTINGIDYHNNTSPLFAFKDTAIVCYHGTFTYPFIATDPVDNDSISYSFGNGLNVTSSSSMPFYSSLTYNAGYSGASPMGSGVTINPVTGLISGTAPATAGEYVIAVYVSEWRKGVLIDAIKKELQIYVYDCSLTAAELKVSYINCNNFTFTFENESSATNINSYNWNFGDINSSNDVSTEATPAYTYSDTGTYTLKLKVQNAGGCSDSTTSQVKVYPGFTADFTVSGSCYQSPFIFTDASTTKYGHINSWQWNFGDPNTTADTSTSQNAAYQYSTAGTVTATLIVGSDKGCLDTASKTVVVNNKPQITLPFTDTLICSGDKLPIPVQSSGGSYSWTPNYNISNTTISNPVVYPADTTVYTVTVQDKACVDSAKLTVNVLPFVTVTLPADTAICATDSITLQPQSEALSYVWTASKNNNSLTHFNIKNPIATPLLTTLYYVTANLGHCQDKAHETVYVSPYPVVSVSGDTSICFGTAAYLRGSTTAAYFIWAPTSSLQNATTLTPVAAPSSTTAYLLTVKDTFYCPKPVTDTVVVHVIPPVKVNAGNDTTVVLNQPLQLLATSSADTASFAWQSSLYLNNAAINNPVATFTNSSVTSYTYLVTATTPQGCKGEDSVTIYIYKSLPGIFIPSAFTPNEDGLNDVLIPVLAGIKEYDGFSIYNRWGQLVFHTSKAGAGWDGTINGLQQPAGTYVYIASGKNYTGRVIEKKGTVVLIR